MSDYSAEVDEMGVTATQTYDTGTEVTVELSGGFIRVSVDGKRVFRDHWQKLRDNPEDRVAERLSDE
jgi:hypothetical protein